MGFFNLLSKFSSFMKLLLNHYLSVGKFSRGQIDIFLIFPQHIAIDMPCKLFPKETICMKCLIYFLEKNKKKMFQNVLC